MRAIWIGVFALVVIPAIVFYFGWDGKVVKGNHRLPETVGQPLRQGPAADTRRAGSAAKVVRGAQIHVAAREASSEPPFPPEVANRPSQSNGAERAIASKAGSAAAPNGHEQARKSAEELVADFLADNPAEVFPPESIRYHAAVQSEQSDPDWGPAASQAMCDFVIGALGARIETPVCECRTNLCELDLVGRNSGPGNEDANDFQQVISAMRQQPWWTTFGFDQQTGTSTFSPDGRAVMIFFFSRS